jgi:hypothetical protein
MVSVCIPAARMNLLLFLDYQIQRLSRHWVKEPLINSGSSAWRDEMFRIKAKSIGNSRLLRSFHRTTVPFSRHAPGQELI